MKHEIYLAGGCFWGTEAYIAALCGVIETEVGYANGTLKNPSYEDVCTGKTGHAETVRVCFDPDVLPLESLLLRFYESIDPTLVNKQGHDEGHQYRTGIYYVSAADEDIIARSLTQLQQQYATPIVTENLPLSCFYRAEEYHQKYLQKNPCGYCHIPATLLEKAKKRD